jgi:hypothetical protein
MRRLGIGLLLLLAAPSDAETRRAEVPLVIPFPFLERLLVEQVFDDPGMTARVVAASDACNEIVLSSPALRPLGGRVSSPRTAARRRASPPSARAGARSRGRGRSRRRRTRASRRAARRSSSAW